MPRETVAQRNERIALERQMSLAAEVSEYPARLVMALERATTSFDFELTVREGLFVLTDREAEYKWEREFELAYAWSAHSQVVLENLERALEVKAEERAERERLTAVKREAERKVRELLSDEERELLGL